jgi:ATP-binding cassette subfamily B protein
VFQSTPNWSVANVVLTAIQGVLPLISLYVIKNVIDVVAAGISANDKQGYLTQTAFWIVLATVVALVVALCRSLSEFAGEAQTQAVSDAVSDVLHAQSVAVDLGYYEDPDYQDTLHRAQTIAPYRIPHTASQLFQLGQNGLSIAGIAGLLFSVNWMLAILVVLVAIPAALVRLIYARKLYAFEQQRVETDRRAWYYHEMLTGIAHAKEIRLFDLGALFVRRYSELRQILREGRLAIARRRSVSDFLAQGVASLAIFGSLGFASFQAIQGAISMGDLVIFYQGFQMGLGFLQGMLRGVAQLYEDDLFLTNYFDFLDLQPQVVAQCPSTPVPAELRQGVVFSNVSFTYPGSATEVLHNVTLSLPPGAVIALVGENGSGKTTLVKLLCRLYDPTGGQITVDGIDMRRLQPAHWRRRISVVFQDLVHYYLPAWENIWLGDVERPADMERIADAARAAGADAVFRRLPQGVDTVLGQLFQNGQEISIGEWQKVALARAFMRDSGIVVLDEPSSALDPLVEADLFRRFREIIRGRSAVLISHRFSTVQMADHIYVLERGRIVEGGTHQELLKMGGRYALLYGAQAEHYQDVGTPSPGDGPELAGESGR